jgi:putative ABC transport system ATP-binding protein
MEERLLAARRAFAAGLPPELRSAVEFYDFGRYNSAATLQDNILFGRLVYGQAQAEQRIGTLIAEVLDELKLRDSVIEVGLEYNVGVAGKRLPATQRQKLGIARAVIKRPRPAQAEPFEQIVVMQGGRIAAQGAPADLAARGGLYAELMASA